MGLLIAIVSIIIIYSLNVIAGLYGLVRLFQIVTNYKELPGISDLIDFVCRGVLFLFCILIISSFPQHTGEQDISMYLIKNLPGIFIQLSGVTVLFMSLMANVWQGIYYLCIKNDVVEA